MSQKLETRIGEIAKTVLQFDPSTIQHSDEIMKARRLEENEKEKVDLMRLWYSTPDYFMYTNDGKEVSVYIGRGSTNPIFNNIEEAITQGMTTGKYIVKKEDMEAIKNSDSTLKFGFRDLELKKDSLRLGGVDILQQCCYISIDTTDYHEKLNKGGKMVTERFFGKGHDLDKNMDLLKQNGVKKTCVEFLAEDYVKKIVPKDGAIALIGNILGLGNNSRFLASGRNVNDYSALRGVPLHVSR